jgi:hypothetical protein
VKSVIAWMKANVAIVALSAVIVVTLPAAFAGSSMWNKRIRTTREAEANKAMTDLGALRTSYVIPSPLPGRPAITLPLEAPNSVATEYFKEHRRMLEEQIGRVVEVARDVNARNHRPLVDDLFPTPANRLKSLEMAEVLVGRDGKPSAYQAF